MSKLNSRLVQWNEADQADKRSYKFIVLEVNSIGILQLVFLGRYSW